MNACPSFRFSYPSTDAFEGATGLPASYAEVTWRIPTPHVPTISFGGGVSLVSTSRPASFLARASAYVGRLLGRSDLEDAGAEPVGAQWAPPELCALVHANLPRHKPTKPRALSHAEVSHRRRAFSAALQHDGPPPDPQLRGYYLVTCAALARELDLDRDDLGELLSGYSETDLDAAWNASEGLADPKSDIGVEVTRQFAEERKRAQAKAKADAEAAAYAARQVKITLGPGLCALVIKPGAPANYGVELEVGSLPAITLPDRSRLYLFRAFAAVPTTEIAPGHVLTSKGSYVVPARQVVLSSMGENMIGHFHDARARDRSPLDPSTLKDLRSSEGRTARRLARELVAPWSLYLDRHAVRTNLAAMLIEGLGLTPFVAAQVMTEAGAGGVLSTCTAVASRSKDNPAQRQYDTTDTFTPAPKDLASIEQVAS